MSWPLVIASGGVSYTLAIPQHLHRLGSRLISKFVETLDDSLPSQLQDYRADDSAALLVTRWLEFLAQRGSDAPYDTLLRSTLRQFETKFLAEDTIHAFVSQIQVSKESKQQILRSYFLARSALSTYPKEEKPSSLLRAAARGSAKLYGIFGGQGTTVAYFEELRSLYDTYGCFIEEFVASAAGHLLTLSQEPAARDLLDQGLDTMRVAPTSRHHAAFQLLALGPYKPPSHWLVTAHSICRNMPLLGQTPEDFLTHFRGITGHSQGIIVAAAVAGSTSWTSFTEKAHTAITVLFSIGLRCQEAIPHSPLDPAIMKEAVSSGVGAPSPMLSVRDLQQSQLREHVDAINGNLPVGDNIEIGLRNGPRNFIVAGQAKSLYALHLRLKGLKASSGKDQTRVPFSKRGLDSSARFLPMTAPFHHSCMGNATRIITDDLDSFGVVLKPEDLRIPVFDSTTGKDIRLYRCR